MSHLNNERAKRLIAEYGDPLEPLIRMIMPIFLLPGRAP